MNKSKYYINKSFILLFTVCSIALAQTVNYKSQQISQPLYKYYSSKEYKSSTSNWSIIQDRRGVMYVGNAEGVLEFDGSIWRKIELSRSPLVRGFAMDDDGRIYLTADTDVGYLEPDSTGQMKFTSIMAELNKQYDQINEVWDVAANSNGIFFKTNGEIYRWKNNKLKTWDSVYAFRLYEIEDEIYSRNNGVGLVKISGDSLTLIPGGEYFSSIGVFDMLPFKSENPKQKNKILITTNYSGVFLYDGQKVVPFKTEIDDYLRQNQIYNACILSDGSYAFATQRGGVVVLDRDGKVIKIIDENSGLLTNVVYDVYSDTQGGLWMATDNGIARTEIPSPIFMIPQKNYFNSSITSVARYENKFYAANSIGILYLDDYGSTFKLTKGSNKPGYSFLEVDKDFLASTNWGVVIVKGNRIVKKLTDGSSYRLTQSKYFPERIYVCHRRGLTIINKNHMGLYDVYPTYIEEEELYSIVEESKNSLWIWSQHGRIIHINGDLKYLDSDSGEHFETEIFDESTGFQVSDWDIFDIYNKMILTTGRGTFAYSEKSKKFIRNSTLGSPLSDSTHTIRLIEKSTNGNLWVLTDTDGRRELGKAVRQKGGNYNWKPNPVFRRLDLSNALTMYTDIDSISGAEVLWISTDDRLVQYNPEIIKDVEYEYSTLIRKVQVNNDSLIFGGTRMTDSTNRYVVLPFANNDITFQFSALSFDNHEATFYQYFLEGNDDEWSHWTNEVKKEYTNLSSGDYKFRVRSKNVYGVIGSEDNFKFKVLPPWYFSWWAYLLYGLLLAIAIFAADRIMRKRVVARERNRAKLREAELIKKQAEELETVDRLVRVINRADDLERLFNSLLVQTISFIPQAEKAAVFLLDHSDNKFHVAYTSGYEVDDVESITFLPEELDKRYTENSDEIEKGIYIVSHTKNLFGDKKKSDLKKPMSMLVMAVEWEKNLEAYVVFDSFADKNAFDPSTARILNRFREHAVSAISKAQSIKKLQEKNEEIIKAQEQLVVQEKLASLGALTAGIAHEIKNPLNFVNNFAEVSSEMLAELNETIEGEKNKIPEDKYLTMKELIEILKENFKKIGSHGMRADSIIKGMLEHSRGGTSERTEVNINNLLDQYVDLAYHGLRAQDKEFNITIERNYDRSIEKIKVVPQDVSRVFLNIINNACYAANQKKQMQGDGFNPILKVSTINLGKKIEIRIMDNGNGIPKSVRDNIFDPFFTTKPTGEGTGLGLSLSYDIITKVHGGELKVDTKEGEGTTFIILLTNRN